MSWYVTIPPTPEPDFEQVVNALTLPEGTAGNVDTEEQFMAAKAAVKALFAAVQPILAAAGSTPYYAGSMNGHANPSHQPTPGWSSDYITVSVSQVAPPPVE